MTETLWVVLAWLGCLGASGALFWWQHRAPQRSQPWLWTSLISLCVPIPLLKIDLIVPGGALLYAPFMADDLAGFVVIALLAALYWALSYAIVRIVMGRFGGKSTKLSGEKPAG